MDYFSIILYTFKYDSRSRAIEISIPNVHTQIIEYDNLNRIIKKTEKVGFEKIFLTETVYDTYGRISKEIYPSGFYIINGYDANGYLVNIKDNNNALIWQANESNAKGQLLSITKGNKTTTYAYDNRNFTKSILTPGVMNMTYIYNAKGNLTERQDVLTAQKEVFNYDTMNRLTSWNISKSGVITKINTMKYEPTTGTIISKSDLQYAMNYGENGAPVHALTSIGGNSDIIPDSDQTIAYTDFKKISIISEGGNLLNISYNTDEEKRKSTLQKNGGVATLRYYVGNYEEEIINGVTKKIHYLAGGNGLAAIYIQNGSVNTLYYAYTDNLGSLIALTDANGNVKEKYSYNPWGNKQNPDNWSLEDTRTAFIVNRGFTMHEHLHEFKLINMNGRVYNPLVAMFLSPDPHIQAPENWLSYNRYAYCLNNPLKYTDPNGEWFGIDDLFVAAAGFVMGYLSHGISEGNWGGKAVVSGLTMAGSAWLGFNTLGVSMGVGQYVSNMAINTATSMVLPSFNMPITNNFGLSISPSIGLGPKGVGGGFNYGATYKNGNKSYGVGLGVGPNHFSYGIGAKSGDVGLSYYRTHYGNGVGLDGIPNKQIVGGVVLVAGGFSFRIENDVLGDRHDRWRTNAVEVGLGKYFVFGTTLNTNDPDTEGLGVDNTENGYSDGRSSLSGDLNKNGKSSWKNGQVYSSPFYVGIKQGNNVYRMGFSHPKVQDMTQNKVHREGFFHTLLPGISKLLPGDFGYQNYYVNYGNFQKGVYFYYGNLQPYSLWGY
ncbi:polymorphic toxin type 23 domain-containing protein [Dysgonomonas sp. ZJ279]|uniref:polymorphic toxin type 23 domain-containing protein n=1 Tax=Dysgonomonas sp. ZJ279 TaxID=2709796 RepID=UPI0013EAF693|nr:polymorphic toxin type 23 domain-containing protein [Dysgonomonas sp. ZJ279]